MARITGLGGVFFKCDDPKALSAWYRDVLGFAIEEWGGALLKSQAGGAPHAVWAPFASDTDYFAPSSHPFMINFAVDDLDGMIRQIEAKGVAILGRQEMKGLGQFAWLIDPAGVKVELWQPA